MFLYRTLAKQNILPGRHWHL